MRNRIYYFTLFWLVLLWLPGCSKEETPGQKELDTKALIRDVNADSIKATVQWLESMGTRFALAENRLQVASAIKNRFVRMGFSDARLDTFAINVTFRQKVYSQKQYNVIASLEGMTLSDTVSIVGAHYDNILSSTAGDPFVAAYGANDNASGVAAVLEVARVMKKNGYVPKSKILFIAFGAEELGLKGSHAHATYAYEQNYKLRCMLNNDMIAFCPYFDKKSWSVNIIDYDNSHDLRLNAEYLAKKYATLNTFNDNRYQKQSDSYPYYLKGYQALFFISLAADPNYHTNYDVSQELNFDFSAEVVKLNCAILVEKN